MEDFLQRYREPVLASVRTALKEDIGSGDITSNAIIPKGLIYEGVFTAKADGVIAGLQLAELIYNEVDNNIGFNKLKNDGDLISTGTQIASVSGPAISILTTERVVLNYMQRMSGIATATKQYADLVSHTKCKVLDTRKTVPGLRYFDKWAVSLSGGVNHRMGLFDMVLIKDNHIEAAGSAGKAIELARERNEQGILIEVEVKTLSELREVLPFKPDRIMLDNMSLGEMSEAVKIVSGVIPLEASGNINLNTVKAIAETGVDFVSVGNLTHSVTALDISFLLTKKL